MKNKNLLMSSLGVILAAYIGVGMHSLLMTTTKVTNDTASVFDNYIETKKCLGIDTEKKLDFKQDFDKQYNCIESFSSETKSKNYQISLLLSNAFMQKSILDNDLKDEDIQKLILLKNATYGSDYEINEKINQDVVYENSDLWNKPIAYTFLSIENFYRNSQSTKSYNDDTNLALEYPEEYKKYVKSFSITDKKVVSFNDYIKAKIISNIKK